MVAIKPKRDYLSLLETNYKIEPDTDKRNEDIREFLNKYMKDEQKEIGLQFIQSGLKDYYKLKSAEIKIFASYFKDVKKEYDEAKKKQRIQKEKNEEKKEDENSIYLCPDEKYIPIEELEEAEQEALKILKEGDPIKFVLDLIKTRHVGDEEASEGILISISNQSCLNSMGIHVAFNGESGSGKSHTLKVILKFLPSRFVFETTLSNKAVYYMKLKEGCIIFSDDTTMSEEMEEVFKRSTTNYQEYTKHTTVSNQEGIEKLIPPRLNWYLTSVDNEATKQVLNRQLTFSTVTDYEHKKEVYEMQQAENIKGEITALKVTKEVLICRRIFNEIKKQTFYVKIPFGDRILMKDVSDSRITSIFFDMIKGYTIFNFMKRDSDEEGKLIATLDDFYKAKKLFESQKDNIVTKMNERELKIIQYIIEHPGCTINNIVEGTEIESQNVRRLLKGRNERNTGGLLEKVKGLTMEDTSEAMEPDPLELSDEEMKMMPTRAYRKAERFKIKSSDALKLYSGDFITLKDDVSNPSNNEAIKSPNKEENSKFKVSKPNLKERQQNLRETMEGIALQEREEADERAKQEEIKYTRRPYINNGEAKKVFDSWENEN
ncbi:hypothetical protein [Methanosarcina mazei]|uniref:DNA primase n=2 Tax=Methanosarcina mazei TaxID=2209 RepID=A0A0F8IK55_METMZ|nr:hypothetical protein [Methanosarcina mazei]AKB61760.1 hypothetical protein MSMAP_1775 [Methanosarcina mazei SarPi]KKG79804.1 hypothetical protein DU55_13090 [Methanosarcina mazei]